MFDKQLMVNLFLIFLQTALLFVEVDGKMTTEKSLAQEMEGVSSSDMETTLSSSQNDVLPEVTYAGKDAEKAPPRTYNLPELLVKSFSSIDSTPFKGSVSGENKVKVDLQSDLETFRARNSMGFLNLIVKSIHNFIDSDTVNTKSMETKEESNIADVILPTRTAQEYTGNATLVNNTGAILITDLYARTVPSTSPQTDVSSAIDSEPPKNILSFKRSGLFDQRLFPFEVAVIVSKPRGPQRNSVTFVPLLPDMTVLDAFISATQEYMHGDKSKADDIPFNIILDWNDDLQCYVTVNAVGIRNRRRVAWYFTVANIKHEVIYKGRCLPGKEVILRPRSSVQLTFEPTRKRPKYNNNLV